jgi:rhamnogalacturonyl hydrolase YesR
VAQNFLPRGHYQDHELLRYPDAIVWFGALKVARETGDNELAGQLIRRFDRYRANPKLVPDKFHVDYSVLGIVPLELYRLTKNPALKKLGMHRADEQWLKPTADGVTRQARYWVDDIYMIAAIRSNRKTLEPIETGHRTISISQIGLIACQLGETLYSS